MSTGWSVAEKRLADERLMDLAITEAKLAAKSGDRPFGCVIVCEGRVVAKAGGSERATDPLRHCELVAIRYAAQKRCGLLQGCTLYSTHEPCAMCAGAICHAKLSRVVYGSSRSDLPHLFRRRQRDVLSILFDTSSPSVVLAGCRREENIALFDLETK